MSTHSDKDKPVDANKVEICVSLITNGNAQRLATALKAISNFMGTDHLGVNGVRTVNWQCGFAPQTRRTRLKRAFDLAVWMLRIQVAQKRSLRFLADTVFHLCQGFIRGLSASDGRDAKRFFAELALTDKHLRAVTNFLEGSGEFLLVFEDDIETESESEVQLTDLLKVLTEFVERPAFVSLSKAFELDTLKAGPMVPRCEHFVQLATSTTNTTAAFAINRTFAEEVVKAVLMNPSLRSLPADWMLNAVLAQSRISEVLHARVGPFINSSLLGLTPSEINP